MVNDILAMLDIPCEETQFRKPPKTTYLVYHENKHRRGADLKNFAYDHEVVFELFAYDRDKEAEARVEAALDSFALDWDKSKAQWLQDERLFVTEYFFDFISKGE